MIMQKNIKYYIQRPEKTLLKKGRERHGFILPWFGLIMVMNKKESQKVNIIINSN